MCLLRCVFSSVCPTASPCGIPCLDVKSARRAGICRTVKGGRKGKAPAPACVGTGAKGDA